MRHVLAPPSENITCVIALVGGEIRGRRPFRVRCGIVWTRCRRWFDAYFSSFIQRVHICCVRLCVELVYFTSRLRMR